MKSYLENIKKRRKMSEEILRKKLKDEAVRLVKLLRTKGYEFKRRYSSMKRDEIFWIELKSDIERELNNISWYSTR